MLAAGVMMLATAWVTPASAATFGAARDTVVAYSDDGEWLGDGEQRIWRGDHSYIGVSGGSTGLTVRVSDGVPGDSFDFSIASPWGKTLETGVYTDAVRSSSRTNGHPGIEVTGRGRGCNTAGGRFEVRDIARDPSGPITRLWLLYEFHCEGSGPAMWGEIKVGEAASQAPALVPSVVRWPTLESGGRGSTVPVTLLAGEQDVRIAGVAIGGGEPTDFRLRDDTCSGTTVKAGHSCTAWVGFAPQAAGLRQAVITLVDTTGNRYDTALQGWSHGGTTAFRMTGDADDWITLGRTYDYTPANARISAYGSRNWLSAGVTGADGSYWNVAVSPGAGDVLTAGTTYRMAHRDPFRGTGPGLEVSGSGRACNALEGTFTVIEARWDEEGRPTGVSLSFEQHCDDGPSSARGTVSWRAGDTAIPAPWSVSGATLSTLPDPPASVTLPVTTPPVGPVLPADPTDPTETAPSEPDPEAPTAPAAQAPSTPDAPDPFSHTGPGTDASDAPAQHPAGPTESGSRPPSGPAEHLRPVAGVTTATPLLTYRGMVQRRRALSFSVRVPGAGTLVVSPSVRVRASDGKARSVRLGRGRLTTTGAGSRRVAIHLTARALRVLATHPRARMTTTMTWNPDGAEPVTVKAIDVLRTR
jgi:hypothetical protein